MCDNYQMVLHRPRYPRLQEMSHTPAIRCGVYDRGESVEASETPFRGCAEEEARLELALSQLTGEQCALFYRHCREGETLVQIAAAYGSTPEEVRRTFCLLCRQLHRSLMETGLGPQEAMDCLYRTLTHHPR